MTGWVWYQIWYDDAPRPHTGGSNYLVNGEGSEGLPVKVAFGFQRQAEDWGEAKWTAKDLR